MIRQSLVEERVSALHHHTLQSPGDNDGDMSRIASRRLPPPVGSRIVIKKNASLLPTSDDIIPNSPSTTPSPTSTPTVDPRSRVDLLERNLRYVQQQHEMTLNDLHLEIDRLQEENRGEVERAFSSHWRVSCALSFRSSLSNDQSSSTVRLATETEEERDGTQHSSNHGTYSQ